MTKTEDRKKKKVRQHNVGQYAVETEYKHGTDRRSLDGENSSNRLSEACLGSVAIDDHVAFAAAIPSPGGRADFEFWSNTWTELIPNNKP